MCNFVCIHKNVVAAELYLNPELPLQYISVDAMYETVTEHVRHLIGQEAASGSTQWQVAGGALEAPSSVRQFCKYFLTKNCVNLWGNGRAMELWTEACNLYDIDLSREDNAVTPGNRFDNYLLQRFSM